MNISVNMFIVWNLLLAVILLAMLGSGALIKWNTFRVSGDTSLGQNSATWLMTAAAVMALAIGLLL